MDLNLKNQTAVVVGAARGIGYAIAHEFAREGASVGLIDRESSIEKIAPELGARFNVADVTNYAAMQQAAAQFRRIDHLIYADGVDEVIDAAKLGSGLLHGGVVRHIGDVEACAKLGGDFFDG